MLEYSKQYYIASGCGYAKERLVAFDNALLSAGISNYNILKVSSILPENCELSETVDLREGSALLTAYGTISSDVAGEQICSAVAAGIPVEKNQVGVIMEYSGHGTKETAEAKVREMTREAMENHGIPYREIRSSSTDAIVREGEFVTVISAISMW